MLPNQISRFVSSSFLSRVRLERLLVNRRFRVVSVEIGATTMQISSQSETNFAPSLPVLLEKIASGARESGRPGWHPERMREILAACIDPSPLRHSL